MLSLTHKTDRLRVADNLLPTSEGGMASRPGAKQIVAGDIEHAQSWGDSVLFERGGRLYLYANGIEHDMGSAGRSLSAAPYQALIGNAERQERLYVADGYNPPWYIAKTGTVYRRSTITNTILDAENNPYRIPAASTIVTWRNRLWIGNQSNRIQHSGNENPDEWDPLWTLEFQGGELTEVRCMQDAAEMLVVGAKDSLWRVTGTSRYNWERNKLMDHVGVASTQAIDGNAVNTIIIARTGVYDANGRRLLSTDLDQLFETHDYDSSCVLSACGRYAYLLIHGRCFCLNIETNTVGEIIGNIRGLMRFVNTVGWYGADGVWALGSLDTPDTYLDGTRSPFTSLWETWDVFPNKRGRAVLSRVHLTVRGSSRNTAFYTAHIDDLEKTSELTLFDSLDPPVVHVWDGTVNVWPTNPVQREIRVVAAGKRFRHRLSAACHLDVISAEPEFRPVS